MCVTGEEPSEAGDEEQQGRCDSVSRSIGCDIGIYFDSRAGTDPVGSALPGRAGGDPLRLGFFYLDVSSCCQGLDTVVLSIARLGGRDNCVPGILLPPADVDLSTA